MTEPTPKLQRGAAALLQDFPLLEPDFEKQALAIQARLASSSSGTAVGDDLLAIPDLPAAPGEPPPASFVRASPLQRPPRSSFAEMARKSLQKSNNDSAGDARELLAATAQSRRPNAAMVERVRAAGRAPANATPLPLTEAGTERAPRASGVMARSATVKSAQNGGTEHRGLWVGLAVAVLALAAGVALLVGSDGESPTTAALMAEEKAGSGQAVGAAEAKHQSEADRVARPSDGTLSPEALAAAPAGDARLAPGKQQKSGLTGARGAAPTNPAVGASSGASSGKVNAVVLTDDPEQASRLGLSPNAPHSSDVVAGNKAPAAPAEEPKLRPAQGTESGVPTTPSAGAVSAALGAVRGGAQACLAGQSAPVSAIVTFGSDGGVSRVSAGGPAGACIQAALSKARIQPFARDSFSASTTIRPP